MSRVFDPTLERYSWIIPRTEDDDYCYRIESKRIPRILLIVTRNNPVLGIKRQHGLAASTWKWTPNTRRRIAAGATRGTARAGPKPIAAGLAA